MNIACPLRARQNNDFDGFCNGKVRHVPAARAARPPRQHARTTCQSRANHAPITRQSRANHEPTTFISDYVIKCPSPPNVGKDPRDHSCQAAAPQCAHSYEYQRSTPATSTPTPQAPPVALECDPKAAGGCTVCAACCHAYIVNGAPCAACAAEQCAAPSSPQQAQARPPAPRFEVVISSSVADLMVSLEPARTAPRFDGVISSLVGCMDNARRH
jgi:hypothetical protein